MSSSRAAPPTGPPPPSPRITVPAAINDASGNWVWDWDHQLEHLTAKYGSRPLEEKLGQAVWRGRYSEPRDWLRKQLTDCSQQAGRGGRGGGGAVEL